MKIFVKFAVKKYELKLKEVVTLLNLNNNFLEQVFLDLRGKSGV
jgi:hypothetical protein